MENKDNKPLDLTKEDENSEILNDIKKLPISENEKENIIASLEMYSGPIPHPNILAGYNALDNGAAKKIIDNGIAESQHRRSMETARQKRRGRLAWASLIALVIICIIFIILSFFLIFNDHEVTGTIFSGFSFITLLGSLNSNITELSRNDDISRNNSKDDKK